MSKLSVPDKREQHDSLTRDVPLNKRHLTTKGWSSQH